MKFIPGGPPRYEHQRYGLLKLIETRGRGALLFDPGTGKTATTFDYLSILAIKSPRQEARVLVVAPLAAIDTWVLQAELWVSPQVNVWAEAVGGSIRQRAEALAARGGQPYRNVKPDRNHPRALHVQKAQAWFARADGRSGAEGITPSEGPEGLGDALPKLIVESVNFDTFSSRQTVGGRTMADIVLDGVKRYAPDVLVIDEMHKIKSPTSNVSRLLARVAAATPRVVGLTGTVMPHGPMDVFAQWRAIDPYAFGDLQPDGSRARATFGGFQSRYGVMGGYMGREVVSFRNLDEMQTIMAERASVARKSEVLDLPATTTVVVPVNLSTKEQRAYDEMKRDLVAKLANSDASASNKLTMMMRLRQITSGHLPDDNGQVHQIGTSKVDTISSIAHDNLAGEKRIVVFALFTHEIEALVAKLSKPGTVVQKITGATPGPERLAIRKRFGSDEDTRLILVAQVKTISLSVNELVTASNAIYGSLSQQRDDQIQSQDRLNRIGQTKPVTFWLAIAPGTVDEVILKSHTERTSLESAMLKHIHEGVAA